jgi:hypothetical protein
VKSGPDVFADALVLSAGADDAPAAVIFAPEATILIRHGRKPGLFMREMDAAPAIPSRRRPRVAGHQGRGLCRPGAGQRQLASGPPPPAMVIVLPIGRVNRIRENA